MDRTEGAFLVRDTQDVELDGEVWGIEQKTVDGGVRRYGIAGADGQAEAARKEAETARAAAETKRAQAETGRVDAETKRTQAESSRASAESARAASEKQRETAESGRASAETARAAAETKRAQAETGRAGAESSRENAEDTRKQAENARLASEKQRETAETARGDAEGIRRRDEAQRAAAEASRAAAEKERAAQQAKNNADQQQNNEAAKGLVYHICQPGEYQLDATGAHNVPTITGKLGVVYWTPMVAKDHDYNRFEEWAWVDGGWELKGETKHVAPATTGDIDKIAAGQTVSSTRVLDTTGLSYLWTKLKTAFAAITHKHATGDVTGLDTALGDKATKAELKTVQDSLDKCVLFQGKMKPTLLWGSIDGSPSEYGLYVIIDGSKFLLGGKFVS